MMRRYYAEGMKSRHAAELFLKKNRHDWKALRGKKVLVAGAGGLGNFTVAQLVGSGVEEIHVVDPDVVEPHNLNRQFLYSEEDVGRKKVEVLAERMEGRPARVVGIDATVEEVDISDYDVVLDCLDTWETKMWLVEEGNREGVPVVFMSVGEGKGMVSVPEKPLPFKAPRSRAVSTPEIALTSSVGVSEAIRILEGREPLLRNRLFVFDVETLSFEVIELP